MLRPEPIAYEFYFWIVIVNAVAGPVDSDYDNLLQILSSICRELILRWVCVCSAVYIYISVSEGLVVLWVGVYVWVCTCVCVYVVRWVAGCVITIVCLHPFQSTCDVNYYFCITVMCIIIARSSSSINPLSCWRQPTSLESVCAFSWVLLLYLSRYVSMVETLIIHTYAVTILYLIMVLYFSSLLDLHRTCITPHTDVCNIEFKPIHAVSPRRW